MDILFFYFLVILVSFAENRDHKRVNIGIGRNENSIFGVGNDRSFYGKNAAMIGYGNVFENVSKPFRNVWSLGQRTFIYDNDKDIYGFGSDCGCALGIGYSPNSNTLLYPKKLEKLSRIETEILDIEGTGSHSIALGKNGSLWVWGSNSYGCLGIGKKDENYEACEPIKIIPSGFIVEIDAAIDFAIGMCHTLIVGKRSGSIDSNSGNNVVLGAGCNERSELGIENGLNKYFNFTEIEFDRNFNIIKVSTGFYSSFFLSENGDLFFTGHILCEDSTSHFRREIMNISIPGFVTKKIHSYATAAIFQSENNTLLGWGCNDGSMMGKVKRGFHDTPVHIDTSKITKDGEEIKKIVSGDGSVAILTYSGTVWFMGRFGRNPKPIITDVFKKMNLGSERIKDIGGPGDHFPTISDDELFCTGDNNFYQCGMLPQSQFVNYTSFYAKEFLENDITSIHISSEHGFGVASDGSVYSIGGNSFGQLGVGNFEDYVIPIEIDFFSEQNIRIVGGNVYVQGSVFLSDEGAVYVVGNGEYGCLGLGNFLLRKLPTEIDQSYFGKNNKVTRVLSLHKHVHALTEDGSLYSWGFGGYGNLGFGDLAGNSTMILSPKKQTNITERIIYHAVGPRYVIVVTENNTIYEWGTLVFFNSDLNNNCSDIIWKPRKLKTPPWEEFGGNVIFVEAGDSFALVGVEVIYPRYNFTLYWWGFLGCDQDKSRSSFLFTRTPKVMYTSVVKLVYCTAQSHAICIDERGRVFGLGNNQYKQLGPFLDDPYYYKLTHTKIEEHLEIITGREVVYGYSKASVSDFSTILQEFIWCNRKLDSDLSVCSGHGVCIANDTCYCSRGYGGKYCSIIICRERNPAHPKNESTVNCNGHGHCKGPDVCDCDLGWSNIDQRLGDGDTKEYGYCKYMKCPLGKNGSSVCSGNGKCNLTSDKRHTHCVCKNEYRGSSCSFPRCWGVDISSDSVLVDGCNSWSTCVSKDKCKCKYSQGIYWPTLPLLTNKYGCRLNVGRIILMIVGVSIFFSGFVCCVCCCFVVCISLFNFFCCYSCITLEKIRARKALETQINADERRRRRILEFHDYKTPYEYFQKLDETHEKVKVSSVGTSKSKRKSVRDGMISSTVFVENGEKVKSSETTILIDRDVGEVRVEKRIQILWIDDWHVFEGDIDGLGTIFYVRFNQKRQVNRKRKKGDVFNKKLMRLFPVFRGSFQDGKREGNGTEYKVHYEEHPVHPDFYEDVRNFRFTGHYSDDMRHGKGIEYYDDEPFDDNFSSKKNLNKSGEIILRRTDSQLSDGIDLISTDEKNEKINMEKNIVMSPSMLFGEHSSRKRFEGNFKMGMRNGKGIEYSRQGYKSLQGIWMNGRVVKIDRNFVELPTTAIENFKFNVFNDSLGSGSGGDVFRIEFRGKPSALKILRGRKSLLDRMRQEQKFTRSLTIWSKFHQHPNILQLYCWSGLSPKEEKKSLGYVMELCETSLAEMITRRQLLNWNQRIRILYEISEGMEHLHSQSVMHRDLKCENILIDSMIRPKICDFEFARYDDLDWKIVASNKTVLGTPAYLAPEIILGKGYTKACDVYSFGILVFAVYFNETYPFDKISYCEKCESVVLPNLILTHVANCELKPFVDETRVVHNTWLLEDIMNPCLEHNPDRRPSFKQILEIFRKKEKEKYTGDTIDIEFEDEIEITDPDDKRNNSSINSDY